MADRMVTIINTVNKTVVISKPEFGIRRVWKGKNTRNVIPFSTLEQMNWDIGVRNLLESGVLYIENMQDKIDLGLEAPDTKVPTNIRILNDSQMTTLWKIRTFEEFKKELDGLSMEQIKNLAQFAIHNEIIDMNKCAFLKEIVNVDIIKAITQNRELTEIDKREKENRGDSENKRGPKG